MAKPIKYLSIYIIFLIVIVSSLYYFHYTKRHKVNIFLVRKTYGDIQPSQLSQGLIQITYPNPEFKNIPKKVQIDTTPFFKHRSKKPFSCIWHGLLYIKESGLYTIGTTSDDGSWIYIDDKLIVDNGGRHENRCVLNQIQLEKGFHKLSIHYFDKGGDANLEINWANKKIAPYTTLMPKAYLVYPKSDYKKVYVNRLNQLNKILPPSLNDKIYITGFLKIEEKDKYDILIRSNDRVGIRIGRTEYWFNPGGQRPITIEFKKKISPITVELENTSGNPSLEFYWAKSGYPLEKIPTKYFSYEKN